VTTPSADPPSLQLSAKYRVLVAEDEALIRLDLVEMLTEAGYDVIGEVSDGESAITLARDSRPDVVILDVKMPVMDGITAAETIVKERLAAVLMLTAFSQHDLVVRAKEAGAMAYLLKPFTIGDLIPAIEIAVGRHQEMLALENEVENLGQRLETRKAVERAKGILMATMGVNESDAFRWIQKASMDRRLSMRAVADAVISKEKAPEI
jgi:AmiR/NasT family two-component response regulator